MATDNFQKNKRKGGEEEKMKRKEEEEEAAALSSSYISNRCLLTTMRKGVLHSLHRIYCLYLIKAFTI